MSGAIERIRRAGEQRAELRRREIAGAAGALGGIAVSIEGEQVVLEGRGLLDRWIREASLRNIGRIGA